MDTSLPHMKILKVAISYRWIMVRHSIFAIGILGMLTGCAAVVQDVPAPRGSNFEREPEPATIKGAILTIIAGNPFGGPQKDLDDLVRRLMLWTES